MSKFPAALGAVVVVLGAAMPARAAESLRLEDAFQRVIETHPDLAVLRFTEVGLASQAERAAQSPALMLGAGAENALGTGGASGVNGAEFTLSLASVLERGGKRAARIALADRRLEGVELLREGKRLDLLAEVARRYLGVASAQAIEAIARADLAQRERTLDAASKRVAAGGAPESVRLAAEAARIRARGEVLRTERAQALAKRRLALMWGEGNADFDVVAGDLTALPPVPEYADLTQRLAGTPELRRFAHEARLREARVQLARSARTPDIEWHVGVRRLQADSDWGLVGSVAIPLGATTRASPELRAADAELAALDLERESQARMLEATLVEAWGQLDAAVADALRLERELLPQLQRAEQAAERAYRAGAASYLEWAQLQTETTAARRERLDASLTAHRALIELQRLTGETLQLAGDATKDSAP